ncbi:MAG: hypothetical protein ACFE9R_12485, partial [Candidatus Hermodarchaeota archaeon]
EITSFIRVLNNYYYIKSVNQGLKERKQTVSLNHSMLRGITDDALSTIDSFKFPSSIILFEAWMNLGMKALFPKIALHYRFPGFLKGEKVRNLIQFTFSTSRGFGFPIYFGPEFYGYKLTYGRFLESIFRWSHTVCHRANQAIHLIGRMYNIKRHHPGEFESVIISEYENNYFKAIDTLLHGYFTSTPKMLGKFPDFVSTLKSVVFSYSIGDHAMSVNQSKDRNVLKIPIISNETILKHYNIDFFSYILKLKSLRLLLIKKIILNKRKRIELISKIKFSQASRINTNRSLKQLSFNNKIMNDLLQMLWITPLFTHTSQKDCDSVFLEYIKTQENEYDLKFKEEELLTKLIDLNKYMATMWLGFKEKFFNLALKMLKELSNISLTSYTNLSRIDRYLYELIPIFSIYEIFNRPLSKSIYPESIPQTKRLGAYVARFLTSKYNIFGVNLMHLFNELAYHNWIYLMRNKKITLPELFNLILKLPIWKYIPPKVKNRIAQSNMDQL